MTKAKKENSEELEDILLEEEEDDKKEDFDQDDSEEKSEEEVEDDEDSSEDKDSEPDPKKEEVSEDIEAKRERRRREKRMRREKARRESAFMQNEIARLQQELRQMKEQTGKFVQDSQLSAIEAEKKEIANVYNTAQKVMAAAISDGDGEKFAEAKAISDKAYARYNLLEGAKQKYAKESSESDKKEVEPQGIIGEEGKRYGIAWVKKNSSWYDPNGGNLDSKIAQTIDTDLYNEGYDPNTKEYWDEFDDRCREKLPHRYKVADRASKQIVGGGGKDSNPSTYKSISVPKEFLHSLKAAGYEKGTPKYNAAIKHYIAQKKGA